MQTILCHPRSRGWLLVAALAIASTSSLAAQEREEVAPVVPTEILQKVWTRIQAESKAELTAAKTDAAKQATYVRMIERLVTDPEIARLRDEKYYRDALEKMAREVPDAVLAKSTNAPLTNPVAGRLVERSGFTDLLALAGDFREVFSANESAVSLNLNALALIAGGPEGVFSAPFRYRQHEALKRLGGTVTFGAKIPDGEITGFTGLPDADTLLDVFVWDVKVRLVGDRDPRASRWYPFLAGEMGDTTELAARISHFVPDEDKAIVATAANEVLGSKLAIAKRRIGSSLQVSTKVSGQHLTKEKGKNKFVIAGMLDKGFGGVDLTANVSYNVVDDVQEGATDPFTLKEWQIGAGLTGSVLKDVISTGRSAELSASVSAKLPVDDSSIPIERKDVWRVGVSLVLPFLKSATIPVSVTYSNDPNNLTKENYVRGHIGISYDFGSLFRPLGTGAAPKP